MCSSPYQLEGDRWHLLTKVFSNATSFEADLHSELLLQERLIDDPKHRSFSCQVLRKASETSLERKHTWRDWSHYPLLFLNARRGAKLRWGVIEESQVIVYWSGLDSSERAEIIPTLASTDNRIILTYHLGPEKTITPRSRLALNESYIPKAKPAGKKCGGE